MSKYYGKYVFCILGGIFLKEYIINHKSIILNTFYSLILLLITIILLMPYLNYIFVFENRVIIHSLFELLNIFIAYSIFVYGWYAYPYILSRTYLWLPIIFFSLGTLSLLHMLTYAGMPTFITESSEVKEAWFAVLGRLIQAIGMLILILFLLKDKKGKLIKRNWLILPTSLILLIIASIIFINEDHLPAFILNGQFTLLTKITYSSFFGIFAFSIICIIKNLKKVKDIIYIYLLIGISFLLISSLFPIIFNGAQGYYNLFIHLLYALGSVYIFIGFYSSKLQLTFLEKEKIEEDLTTTQTLLEAFFDNTPAGMLILDKQGKVIRANKGFEVLLGTEQSDIIGSDFKTIFTESKDINEKLEGVLNGLKITNFEISQKRGNGETVYLLITLSGINNSKNNKNIAVVIKDITERKQFEQRLQEAKQELTDTIRQQQGIIFKYHKVDNSFIHTFFDGELLYNIGLTPEKMIGHKFKSPLGDKELDHLIHYYQTAWDGLDVNFELKWKQSTLAVSLKPIKKGAKVVEVVGSIIDITQLKKTEELLRKSEKLAVVGELAAGVAHEIRNPLTTLKGFTQLLREEVDQKRLPLFDFMSSELERIEMITNEFMTIAKPQAIEYKATKIKKIINQVLAILEPQAILQNVVINNLDIDTDIEVLCDENQLKQVFINIIKNAFEAMPNGGNLMVEIKEASNHYIAISIRDTGVGIPEEIIPKLCEPFYTLKEKGTGLGLMVSYRIIEAHKGNIEFSSELSKGTEVKVKLPQYSNVSSSLRAV